MAPSLYCDEFNQPQHHFGYNTSEAAATHLTKLRALEVAENRLKIRINGTAPGVFLTAGESGEHQKSHIGKSKYAKVPARCPGNDEDVTRAALFIAANQYLNGQTVPTDGGYILNLS